MSTLRYFGLAWWSSNLIWFLQSPEIPKTNKKGITSSMRVLERKSMKNAADLFLQYSSIRSSIRPSENPPTKGAAKTLESGSYQNQAAISIISGTSFYAKSNGIVTSLLPLISVCWLVNRSVNLLKRAGYTSMLL